MLQEIEFPTAGLQSVPGSRSMTFCIPALPDSEHKLFLDLCTWTKKILKWDALHLLHIAKDTSFMRGDIIQFERYNGKNKLWTGA